MALNVAVPLSGIGELFEGCGLLSPISPLEMNFRDNFKMLAVSPDSESSSSGVSSLDSDEAKKFHLAPHLRSSSTPTSLLTIEPTTKLAKPSPRKPNEETTAVTSHSDKTESSTNVSTTDDEGNDDGDEDDDDSHSETTPSSSDVSVNLSRPVSSTSVPANAQPLQSLAEPQPKSVQPPLPPIVINYGGRNVLDLAANLVGGYSAWPFQYTVLPENNFPMFLANRSQYHRLGSSGHIQEFSMAVCGCHISDTICDLSYPVCDQPVTNASPTSAVDLLRQFVQSLEPPQPPRFANAVPQHQSEQQSARNQLFNGLNLNMSGVTSGNGGGNINNITTNGMNGGGNMQFNTFVNNLMGNNVGGNVNMGNNNANNSFNSMNYTNNNNNHFTNHHATLNRIQHNFAATPKFYAHSFTNTKHMKPQNVMASMNMYKQF